MARLRPLVVESGQLQQLQPGYELDIPLEGRVTRLEMLVARLGMMLVEEGFTLPEPLSYAIAQEWLDILESE